MKRVRLIYLLFFFYFFSFLEMGSLQAQFYVDSLKNLVKITSDMEERCDLYYEIATEYYYISSDSSLYYTRKYLDESQKLGDPRYIGDALYWMADLYYYSNLDSAYFYCDKYMEVAVEIGDSVWIGEGYDFLAYANYLEGKIELALENFQTALKYFLAVDTSSLIGAAYNNIGFAISYGVDQTTGLSYFLKALEIAEEINDSSLISDVFCNIAYYYDRVKDYVSAHSYYQQSLEMDLTLGDSTIISQSYANLANMEIKMGNFQDVFKLLKNSKGYISQMHTPYMLSDLYSTIIESYLEWNHVDSAQHYLDKLEVILSQHEYPIQDAYLNQQKGFLYFLKEDYRGCITYLDKSIAQFRALNSLESFALTYKKRAEAYAELGLHAEAYRSQLLANSITDSLKYDMVAGLLSTLEQDKFYRSELEQNQLKADLITKSAEISKIRYRSNLSIALITIILLVILVGVIVYTLYSIREKNETLKAKNNLIIEQKLQLEKHLVMLQKSEEELKEINAAKDKFFSIIAHDLRNPFSAISGLSELLLEDQDTLKKEDVFPIIRNILAASKHGFSLLENLLEWAKSQTGSMNPNPVELSIEKTMKKLVPEFDSFAANKNIEIKVECNETASVYADKDMVHTIMRNLIHNALKFSHKNSVVKICSCEKGPFLVTSIEDQGIGITKTELKNLFSIDGQIRKTGTAEEKGSGLGLILCKEFVDKNNGEIWATGQEKQGSKFSFSLPLFEGK